MKTININYDDEKPKFPVKFPGAGRGDVSACLVRIYPASLDGGISNLTKKISTIGRSDECDIVLEGSSVSRRHAKIALTPPGYVIRDLNSQNGTYVGDKRVKQCVLKNGARIRIGKNILRFLYSDDIEIQYHETLYSMMITDGLTGISNKRYFMDALEREVDRSQRHSRPLALAMLDIDHFKPVNDTHGHLAGDMVLRRFCQRVKAEIRKDEIFARYGGEEFGVILPETNLEQAVAFGERILEIVRAEPFDLGEVQLPVTASVGVAQTCGKEPITTEGLIALADKKLYEAKQAGRDRVVG